jgi:hypothetical protein
LPTGNHSTASSRSVPTTEKLRVEAGPGASYEIWNIEWVESGKVSCLTKVWANTGQDAIQLFLNRWSGIIDDNNYDSPVGNIICKILVLLYYVPSSISRNYPAKIPRKTQNLETLSHVRNTHMLSQKSSHQPLTVR